MARLVVYRTQYDAAIRAALGAVGPGNLHEQRLDSFGGIHAGKVCLGHDPHAGMLLVHHQDTAYPVAFHFLLAYLHWGVSGAGNRISGEIVGNGSGARILALSHNRDAQITVGNNSHQMAGHSVGDHGQSAYIVLLH